MKAIVNDRTPLLTPEFTDSSQVALPPLPSRFDHVRWPDMPGKMLVVIDGMSDTKKSLIGEWVADALGGLFVDADHIYSALVAACSKAGVDVGSSAKVESWCERAGVDLEFASRGGVLEAHVAIDGVWSKKCDVENHEETVLNRAAQAAFWTKVRQALRGCDLNDRVVIVGSDIGYEFPNTPYKFFLDNTSGQRNPADLAALAYPWTGEIGNYTNPGVTYFDRAVNTLIIDASRATPADAVVVILVESVVRACEVGLVDTHPHLALADAYSAADATRQRMKAALSQNSN